MVKKKQVSLKKIAIYSIGAVAILLFIFLALLTSYFIDKPGQFNKLSAIAAYAQSLEEYPLIDNANWYNPDYTSHYESQRISFFDRILIASRIKRDPEWAMETFDTLITDVAKEREMRKLNGACVQGMVPQDGGRYYVWTDLQGALHSFVRCLLYLKEQSVINDDLIMSEDCFFIFNGNLLGQGPYIMQLFSLVLLLMHKNPNNVFFIRSKEEQPGGWYDSMLARALRIFDTKTDSDEVVPYSPEIDDFLQTLPDVFYLLHKKNNIYEGVEIAFSLNQEDSFIRECGHITLLDTSGEASLLSYDKEGEIDGDNLIVRSLIVKPDTVKRMLSHPDGLIPAGFEGATFKWITFSSPSGRSHQIYQFFYDTIIEIGIHGPIDDWTISEHKNDVRDTFAFDFGGAYNITNGSHPGDKDRISHIEQKIAETKKALDQAKRACAGNKR